ncbi:hypothetical protein [Massilia soli]|uniref:Uncharacterized protein n=1 Tax=Massilia soli TaxID=2792854 RepID=A0ABS7SNA1_9BURK|nr:hypothetical protein [Massilia soli]MBZ2207671.1 hypothetical protein [Massilia soli]
MQRDAPAAAERSATTYTPFSSLWNAVTPDALDEARRRVTKLGRADLIRRYRTAFTDGRRLTAYVLAGELVERGVPPCFWHEMLALDRCSVNQRADLAFTDLAWLRRWHPGHASAVRYQRGKALLIGTDAVFHREAGFAIFEGKRPAWKIVGSLSMTERQQWESAYLRSTPTKSEAEATAILSERVQLALLDDLRTTRRTATFGEAESATTLARRHALWRCSRMVSIKVRPRLQHATIK